MVKSYMVGVFWTIRMFLQRNVGDPLNVDIRIGFFCNAVIIAV